MPVDPSPLVSVVLASYNGERFLREQLESILQQTYKNLEIIAVDDFSTDSSAEILMEFARRDQRIRFFRNESNLGYTANFERGLRLAKGDFIAPCDQDDLWFPGKIARLLEAMGGTGNTIIEGISPGEGGAAGTGPELVFADSELIDAAGRSLGVRLSDRKQMPGFDDPLTYAIGGSAPGHGMLFRRELLQRCLPFPPHIPFDYWLGYIATCRQPLVYLDEVLVLYRQHSNNVFGLSVKGKKRKSAARASNEVLRRKMRLLADACPLELPQRKVYESLCRSYSSFSPANNFRRMLLFFRHRDKLLHYKKKPEWRKWLFCWKTFFMLQ